MIVIVIGLPGAGKSFFARRFTATFNAPIVSNDKLRWTLFSNYTYSKDENAIVEQVASLMIDELLVAGKTFVLDGGFTTRAARDGLTKLGAQYGFRTLIVWGQTDAPTTKHRAFNRSETNPGDQYTQSLTPEQFSEVEKGFTKPDMQFREQNTVVISGRHTYSAQAKTVLKKIVDSRTDLDTVGAVRKEDANGRPIFAKVE